MDQLNSTTQHQKGKHLSFEESVIIQTILNDKHSPNKIAADTIIFPLMKAKVKDWNDYLKEVGKPF